MLLNALLSVLIASTGNALRRFINTPRTQTVLAHLRVSMPKIKQSRGMEWNSNIKLW
jgi:hypothetical protein